MTSVQTAACDMLESWKQYCLIYCEVLVVKPRRIMLSFLVSNNIATEMVVIDDGRNGWRHIILPVAHLDELVRDAVLSATAFHFSANVKEQVFDPNVIYARVIRRLHQRQNLDVYDTNGKQHVLLALLVILATVIVNASSDFPTVFNLLESALVASGGEEAVIEGELGVFLVRQIRKYGDLTPIPHAD